jgi:coniferyl-aldehyde dehydrogenase
MNAQPLQPAEARDLNLAARLQAALELQRRAYQREPVPGYRERAEDLRTLARFLRENCEALIAVVNRDYGSRSRHRECE